MKVSEMIKNLQEFMEEHGDLDCWYTVDDEYNAVCEVWCEPSLFYVGGGGMAFSRFEEGIDKEQMLPVCLVN